MTVGLSAVNTANKWLDVLRGASGATFTTPAAMFIACHIGDPGAAGTGNPSTGIATRSSAAMNAASAGSASLTATVSFAATGADTITHISVWTASTSGTFLYSAALSASKTVANLDTLNLTALTFALAPIAA